MKIAQRFSAGCLLHFDRESVKRTTEKVCFYKILSSAVRFTDSLNQHAWIPPMNRWATMIRRLRRLLQQSHVASFNSFTQSGEPNIHPGEGRIASRRRCE